MKRSAFVVPGVAAVVAAAIVALVGVHSPIARAAASTQFDATFDTPSDFYDRFDRGFSGLSPLHTPGATPVSEFHGDHDDACEGPTTDRTVHYTESGDQLDYSQVFWHCAPAGPPSGHVMTGVDTVGYNTAWFSPKPTFTDVTQVCWDINETATASRKWTQVLFVSPDDAFRYPSDRGTGGFDLGYTSPEFRQDAPNNGIFPEGGTLAGVKDEGGSFSWFQNQDTWMTQFAGWPGVPDVTDKAARYTHCLSNQPGNTVRLTQDTPDGTRTVDMVGQIPSGPVRVVFEDDNYDPRKDQDTYDANVLTWHWDNIKVDADSAAEMAAPVEPGGKQAPQTPQAEAAAPVPVPTGSLHSDGGRAGHIIAAAAFGGLLVLFAGLGVAILIWRAGVANGRSHRPNPPSQG